MKFAIIATLAVVASAQDHPVRQAAALQGTLAQFHNAVSRTYATARLGALICKYDPVIGSGILRGAIDDLNSIPADAFKETSTLLPTPSFSALARIVLTAAAKCDSSLGIRVASDRVRARILEERNSVDTLIAEAKGSSQISPIERLSSCWRLSARRNQASSISRDSSGVFPNCATARRSLATMCSPEV